MEAYSQITLASRPKGLPTPSDFRLETGAIPAPAESQILLKTTYLSLDPLHAGTDERRRILCSTRRHRRCDGRRSGCRGRAITAPNIPWRRAGTGADRLANARSGRARAGKTGRDRHQPAHDGIGRARNARVQLAKLAGARAVGIAGGSAKCAYVRDQLRFDAVIDHRAPGLPRALATACPDGIDVYFENVGGPIWEAVLPLLNRYARIPVCGLVAYYNGEVPEGEAPISRTMMTVLRGRFEIGYQACSPSISAFASFRSRGQRTESRS